MIKAHPYDEPAYDIWRLDVVAVEFLQKIACDCSPLIKRLGRIGVDKIQVNNAYVWFLSTRLVPKYCA